MKSAEKNSVFRQLFLTLWAMATLVLCFVVGLLINEMLKGGNDPLAAFSPETGESAETAPTAPATLLNSLGTKEISLFFVDADGHWLNAEPRVIEYQSRTVENCRKALAGLIAGPQNELFFPVIPEKTQVRALYLRPDGELTVDLSSEMLTDKQRPRSAETEALMVYGIVNTMMQAALQAPEDVEVTKVRFLFDGAAPKESFPAHLDLNAPLTQDMHWTRAGKE